MRRAANIKVLPYPAGQHAEVPVFLRALVERVTSAPAVADAAPAPVVAPAPDVSGRRSSTLSTPPAVTIARDHPPSVSSPPAHLPITLQGVELQLSFAQDRLECQLVTGQIPAPVHLSEPVSWPKLYPPELWPVGMFRLLMVDPPGVPPNAPTVFPPAVCPLGDVTWIA